MTRDFDHDPMADALRAGLAEHARQAPTGESLAERIILTAGGQERAPGRASRRGWRTWTLPVVAAGAVAGIVGAVVGIENYHPSASSPAGPASVIQSPSPRVVTSAVSPSATTASAAPVDTATLHDVRVLDLTFAGADDGWALAAADCVHGPGRCTALLRTTNGTKWTSMRGAAFNVAGVRGCADPCVQHLRFADDAVGYAYGPDALFLTNDGGRDWQRQPGGALYVETLDHNVIRVRSPHSGCPSWCDVQVETSSIGSTSWTPAKLSGGNLGFGLAFARGGHDAYLLFLGHRAGGAQVATSTLYRSTDDGQHWTNAGEPCAQVGGEVDSRAVAGGGGDEVSVLCTARQAPNRSFVATSSDAGAHFTPAPGTVPATAAVQLSGDPTTVLVAAGDGLARSTDGGRSWAAVPGVTGAVSFVGFESETVGRAVTDGGATIWTTRDAGLHWSPTRLG